MSLKYGLAMSFALASTSVSVAETQPTVTPWNNPAYSKCIGESLETFLSASPSYMRAYSYLDAAFSGPLSRSIAENCRLKVNAAPPDRNP